MRLGLSHEWIRFDEDLVLVATRGRLMDRLQRSTACLNFGAVCVYMCVCVCDGFISSSCNVCVCVSQGQFHQLIMQCIYLPCTRQQRQQRL